MEEKYDLIGKFPNFYLSNIFSDLKSKIDYHFALKLNGKQSLDQMKIWSNMIQKINDFETECYKYNSKNKINSDNLTEMEKIIFKNKSIFLLSKSENDHKDFFKEKETNDIKLIIISDEYISEKSINFFKKK
jgi:hypothetical protein